MLCVLGVNILFYYIIYVNLGMILVFLGRNFNEMGVFMSKELILGDRGSHVTRGGVEISFLDYVSKCDEGCGFSGSCGYIKGGTCGFEGIFYGQIMKYLRDCEVSGGLDEVGFIHLSMSLLPLYRQLLGLYKVEASLGGKMFIKERGSKRLHPVYGEIRRVISQLGVLWRGAGIKRVKGVDFGMRKGAFKFVKGVGDDS